MKKKLGKISALLLIGCLLLPTQGHADWDDWDDDWDDRPWRTGSSLSNSNFNQYNAYYQQQNASERKLLINGRYDGEAYLYNQTWYIPIDDLIENIGGYHFYNWRTGVSTIQWNGNIISITNNSNQVRINNQSVQLSTRALLLDDGWLDYDYDADDLYVPIDFIQTVLKGTTTSQTQGTRTILVINVSRQNQNTTPTPIVPSPTDPTSPDNSTNIDSSTPVNPDSSTNTGNNPSTNPDQSATTGQALSTISGSKIYTALRKQNGWRDMSYREGEYQPSQLKDEIISYEVKNKAQGSFLEIEVDNQFNRYTNYYGRSSLSKLLNAATDTQTAAQLLNIADTALKTGTHSQLRKRLTVGNYTAYVYLEKSRKGNEIKIYIGNQNFSLFR